MNAEASRFSRFLLCALGALSLVLFGGCLFSEKEGKASRSVSSGEGAEARLVLRTAALTGASASAVVLDSIAIRVTGDGMEPKDFNFSGEAMVLSLVGIPPGANRLVAASLFRQGSLLYRGQTLADFSKEARAEVNLRCEPQFSRVVARFHLSPSLPLKVADGWLTLAGTPGEFKARLVRNGEFGSFLLDEVPGNVRYDVTLSLLDDAAKPIYESIQSGLLLPLGEEAHWELALTPTEGQAALVLELPKPFDAKVGASFPSRLRKPSGPGEAVVSEFHAAPSVQDSSSEGEWWELFNRTSDSLDLTGCRLSRTRGGGATQSFAFDSSHHLPPGRALTFGRSAAATDFHYADFSLVNTASPLLLLCAGDSILVDSLRYSATVSDSLAVPMREGWVTSLNPDSLGRSREGGAWCLTQLPRAGGLASPGWMGECR